MGLRRPADVPRAKPEAAGAKEAMELFEKRNSAWDFTPFEHGGAWTGSVVGPGTLRVVGRSGDRLLVGIAEIPPPAE